MSLHCRKMLGDAVPDRTSQVLASEQHRVHRWRDADGEALIIRRIRPDDLVRIARFASELSDEALYRRFLSSRKLQPSDLERLTQPDHDREAVLVATAGRNADERFIGLARYAQNDGVKECEFGIVVADDWQRQGVGKRLLSALLEMARAAGFQRMFGYTFANNTAMCRLAFELGFVATGPRDDAGMTELSKSL